MSVDPFYAPNRQPAPPRLPRPGELLWEFGHDDGSLGVEAQILCEGEFVLGQRFRTRDLAITWTEEMRPGIEKGGLL